MRVIGGDAAMFRPMLADVMSGEWALLQPAGPAALEGTPCRTSLSISIEVLDAGKFPHDLPRGSARLAFCGRWQDVAIDQVYVLYEGGQSDDRVPSGAACVLRSLEAGDADSRWLLRWRPSGNHLMVTCGLPPDWRVELNEVAGMSETFDRDELRLPPALPSLNYERRP
jgi:hypothetical protein